MLSFLQTLQIVFYNFFHANRLHFNPELIVHRNENIEKMDEMKVRALYHKLNTERQEKERMQKFQQVKEKFARQIEQGDLPEKEKLTENAQASLNA